MISPPPTIGGHSGNPKISGRVFQVLEISGFENCYLKFVRNIGNPTFRVPENSGLDSDNPELPDRQERRLHRQGMGVDGAARRPAGAVRRQRSGGRGVDRVARRPAVLAARRWWERPRRGGANFTGRGGARASRATEATRRPAAPTSLAAAAGDRLDFTGGRREREWGRGIGRRGREAIRRRRPNAPLLQACVEC